MARLLFVNPFTMDFLPDTLNCRLRMRRECRERFFRHLLQRKPLVCNPGMHHGTCVMHVPWCMSWSLIRGGGENVPGIPGACVNRTFTYLAKGPFKRPSVHFCILRIVPTTQCELFYPDWEFDIDATLHCDSKPGIDVILHCVLIGTKGF